MNEDILLRIAVALEGINDKLDTINDGIYSISLNISSMDNSLDSIDSNIDSLNTTIDDVVSVDHQGKLLRVCGMFKEMWQRFTYDGASAKQQAVFFFNIKEITQNKFGTPAPIPFHDW